MAKRLIDIKKNIESENENFNRFFFISINLEIKNFISKLMTRTNVFIFSGIIRDYYLHRENRNFRDIDLIIYDDLIIEEYFDNLSFEKNSFGGYKIKFSNIVIDLWVIKNTWALNQGQLKLEFDHLVELPKTTFFNFSSIIYSLNDRQFIIGKDFLRFIRDKKIELVLDKNPYPELCIVNSFYYSDKLKLNFGDKLKEYLKLNIDQYMRDLEFIQLKHFGKIKYKSTELKQRIEDLQLTKAHKS